MYSNHSLVRILRNNSSLKIWELKEEISVVLKAEKQLFSSFAQQTRITDYTRKFYNHRYILYTSEITGVEFFLEIYKNIISDVKNQCQ